MPDYPELKRLDAHLDAHEGRIGEAEGPLAIAVLEEFLASGAKIGRGLRTTTARFRPADPVGAAIAYLFIVTTDAATHDNREGALALYAESDQPLAKEAGRLYETLVSDEFRQKVGRRPVQGSNRGCKPAGF